MNHLATWSKDSGGSASESAWTGGIDLVYAEGSSLQTNIDLNRTYTTDEFGRPMASPVRPDPTTNVSLTRQSIGESEYQAITFKVNRRFTGKYQMQAHYTLADDKDTDSNERSATSSTASFGGADRSLWNPRYDWGHSEKDIENRLVISGVYLLPWDFKISGIVEHGSGVPYNPTDRGVDFVYCGFTSLGFDCVDARPVDANGNVLQRNSFRNESVQRMDLRLSKFFEFGNDKSVDVFLEVFNLFDDQAFVVCNSFSCDRRRDPENAQFGLASGRLTQPQIYQIGGRFTF